MEISFYLFQLPRDAEVVEYINLIYSQTIIKYCNRANRIWIVHIHSV